MNATNDFMMEHANKSVKQGKTYSKLKYEAKQNLFEKSWKISSEKYLNIQFL